MLRLSNEQYDAAAERMANALHFVETGENPMRTHLGRALVMLEALGDDYDVSPMDPGPTWEPCERCGNPNHHTETHEAWKTVRTEFRLGDVSVMDMGERNDVAEGNVWPDDDLEPELDAADAVWNRAIDAALAVAPKPGKVTSRTKIL